MPSETALGELRIDGQRLWSSLMEMAKIGATQAGGCNRQALTSEDGIGRDLFVSWCKDANLDVTVDEMGNIFARRPGKDDRAPVIAGSHLDTQPTGGKFDGVYGVLASLEVLRTLNDAKVVTNGPMETVVWTNEEGVRFAPAMIGSGVWAGEFKLDEAHGIHDKTGVSISEALSLIGYRGSRPATHTPVRGAFEAHIEQGPILEAEKKQIGVVTGVQGMRWYDVILDGNACHAGPTPMAQRQDPMKAASIVMQRLYGLIDDHAPWGRVTFGDLTLRPGSRNTVPEQVTLAVDIRHPDQRVLDHLNTRLITIVAETAEACRVTGTVSDEWNSPAVVFNEDCVQAVRTATQQLGLSHMEIVSGAGHDSVYVSRVAPTSMIFVPCEGGLSHNEAESATVEDLEAGCNVLLHAMLGLDVSEAA